MAYHPTSGHDSSQPAFSDAGEVFMQPSGESPSAESQSFPETDIADLTARFAASTGPGLSPELSAELALEIVLHEIVEQACLATGATGAAIVLEREGEMVCRASSGPTAPELGARLDGGSGLSGECIRTREIQRCEDAWIDPRADRDASRRLGVRSVLVYPLVRGNQTVGIFETLSSRVSAFGERDERTVEALASRALKNLEWATQPLLPQETVVEDHPENGGEAAVPQSMGRGSSHRGLDVATWALAAVVLFCAVWLSLRVVQRFAPRSTTAQSDIARSRSPQTLGQTGIVQSQADRADAKGGTAITKSPSLGANRASGGQMPEGGLRVYENGKEVFRLPPTPLEHANGSQEGELQHASSRESTSVVRVASDAAENSLLRRVEPEYPEQALAQQIQGPVELDVRINQDGTVQSTSIASGDPLLARAAVSAVKQWRFKPHSVRGRPVEMQTRITIRFTLPPK